MGLQRHGGRSARLKCPCELHRPLQVLGLSEFDVDTDVLGEAPTNRSAFWWGDKWGM
jgi:hypothetical protein